MQRIEVKVDNSSMKSRKGACVKSENRVNVSLHLPYASHVDDGFYEILCRVHPYEGGIKQNHSTQA